MGVRHRLLGGICADSREGQRLVGATIAKAEKANRGEELTLSQMQESLEQAIDEEDYEKAADLRDKVQYVDGLYIYRCPYQCEYGAPYIHAGTVLYP